MQGLQGRILEVKLEGELLPERVVWYIMMQCRRKWTAVCNKYVHLVMGTNYQGRIEGT